jgi:uncharacterized membrane protein
MNTFGDALVLAGLDLAPKIVEYITGLSNRLHKNFWPSFILLVIHWFLLIRQPHVDLSESRQMISKSRMKVWITEKDKRYPDAATVSFTCGP